MGFLSSVFTAKRKRLIRGLSLLVPLVIFYFLFRNIARDWHELRHYAIDADYRLVFLSFVGFTLSNVYVIWVWTRILKKFSVSFDFATVFSIWTVSTLGKYIPGKGWQFLSIMLLGEKVGISLEVAGTTSILAQILMIVSGVIIAFPIALKYLNAVAFWAIVAAMLLILYPPILNRILLFIARKSGRKAVRVDISPPGVIAFAVLYALSWFLYGISFSLLVKSVGIGGSIVDLYLVRVYISSYLIGLFALFVPGGLGVREGIMAVLLSQTMDGNLASFLSVIARIVVTLSELSLTLVGFYILRRKKLLESLKK
ncbi:MAG: hypothetical protein DRQ06_00155 [Candidatus Hydrothermota bacterium]|nr:MAG: hypothetical protein DRQ06_00155 [Candidatus Hydrothermae bacterium]RKZ04563.1 MAG: hypothetical protein DRQ04_00790 [Candidatus Hydrothermae bacterium]